MLPPTVRALAIIVALLVAPLASPPQAAAQGCVPPDAPADFSALHVTQSGVLLANRGYALGSFDMPSGGFLPLVDLTPYAKHVVDEAGQWVVRRAAAPGTECTGGDDSLVAARLANATDRTTLRDDEPRGLAAGPTLVAATFVGEPNVTLWQWGAWDAPHEVGIDWRAEWDARGVVEGYGEPPTFDASRVREMAFSPDGRWLALVEDNRLVVLDLTTERPTSLDRPYLTTDPVVGLAFSPDARDIAVLTSQLGRFSELRVYRIDGGALPLVGQARWGEEARGMAWSRDGLAIAFMRFEEPYDAAGERLVRNVAFASGFLNVTAEADPVPVSDAYAASLAWRDGALLVGGGSRVDVFSRDLVWRTQAQFGAPEQTVFGARPVGPTTGGPTPTATTSTPPAPDASNSAAPASWWPVAAAFGAGAVVAMALAALLRRS